MVEILKAELTTPLDIVEKFEPIDVLDGAIELVDANGILITIRSDDPNILERNEYPQNYGGLFLVIRGTG